VFLVVLALSPSAAYSHEPAAHGGLIAEAGTHHLELVVGEGELVVYVTDAENAPVETNGAQGTAVVLSNRQQTSVNLAPGGQNTLRGTGPFERSSGMRIVVTVSLPGTPALQARFAS
jgi:hypothetical protein